MSIKKFLALVASFSLGFIIGVVSLNFLVSSKMDRLYLEQRALKSELENTILTLEKLEKDKNNQIKHTIKEIKISIDYPIALEQYDIKGKVRQMVNDIVGREVDTIDVVMLEQILHERVVVIESKQIMLYVKNIVLSKTTLVNLRAVEVKIGGQD